MKFVSSKEEVTSYLGQDIGDVLYNLYDGFVRIVDPNEKQVELITEPLKDYPRECYTLWAKNSACENCISLRALATNQSISKLETVGNEIYLVHSIPLTLSSGKRVALEVLKNLSNAHFEMNLGELSINLDPEFSTLLNAINHLNSRVFKDKLTGAYNREYLLTQIPRKFNEKTLTILMLDINGFKDINDTYGHIAGDTVLKSFVETLNNQLRKDKDYLIRYGGDEFIILLSDTNEQLAETIIERLKKAIKEHPAKHEEIEIPYEVSIGSYTVTEPHLDLKKIIHKADEAMYKAKRALKENK